MKGHLQITPLGRQGDKGVAEIRLIAPKTESPMHKQIRTIATKAESPTRRKPMDASAVRLVKKLTDSVDWQARYRAAERLGKMKVPESVDALCEILKKDRISDVRACAAWALGRIGDATALGALKTAENDPNSRVRQTADLAKQAISRASRSV